MIASKLLVLATLGLVAALPQSSSNTCDSDCAGSIAAADTDPENCYGELGILHRTCYICVKQHVASDESKGQANVGDSQKWAAICGKEKGFDWTYVHRTMEEATTKNATSSSSSSSDDKDSDEDADADEDDTTTTEADSKSETASGTASASASASTTPVSSSGAFKAFNVGQLTVAGAAVLGAVALSSNFL